jgi:hypothetical protein
MSPTRRLSRNQANGNCLVNMPTEQYVHAYVDVGLLVASLYIIAVHMLMMSVLMREVSQVKCNY